MHGASLQTPRSPLLLQLGCARSSVEPVPWGQSGRLYSREAVLTGGDTHRRLAGMGCLRHCSLYYQC